MEELKIEIKCMYEILANSNKKFTKELEDKVRNIIKRIIFLKMIFSSDETRDFIDSMIYSAMMLLKILVSKSFKQEQYDLYLRILIEHSFKMVTNKQRDSRKDVFKISDEIKKNYRIELEKEFYKLQNDDKVLLNMRNGYENLKKITEILDYLYDKYCQTSASLHGGKNRLGELSKYYNELLLESTVDDATFVLRINELKKIFGDIVTLIILYTPEIIGKVFYNKMNYFKYLVSSDDFNRYDKIMN